MEIKIMKLDLKKFQKSQGFKRIPIFNEENLGISDICLEYVILPKGKESIPHLHVDTFSVIFTLKGVAKIFYGENLESFGEAHQGDSVYIPPNIIHYVINEYDQEMVAVVARTPSQHIVKEFPELLFNQNKEL